MPMPSNFLEYQKAVHHRKKENSSPWKSLQTLTSTHYLHQKYEDRQNVDPGCLDRRRWRLLIRRRMRRGTIAAPVVDRSPLNRSSTFAKLKQQKTLILCRINKINIYQKENSDCIMVIAVSSYLNEAFSGVLTTQSIKRNPSQKRNKMEPFFQLSSRHL